MLSWEYPPLSVGGLAKHVEEVSFALSQQDVEVHVLTIGGKQTPKLERKNNLWVHRVDPFPLQALNFITWIHHLNFCLLEEAIKLSATFGPFDLVHCHDWLVGFSGKVLKHAYQIPLLATIHATEAGRNQGLHTPEQNYINQIEWWLTYEAWKVIVCSRHMVHEVKQLFNLPQDKIRLIPNGINMAKYSQAPLKNVSFGSGKIVFFVGRLVKEKGVQVLLEAAPQIIAAEPEVRFFIAGKGPMEEQLKAQAKSLKIESWVSFLGYISEEQKITLLKQAQVAVFPSLYEPFGIVVLEAMAAGVPVVAADTGGMGEIISHGISGLKVWPGDAQSLAVNILKVLQDRELAKNLSTNALVVVKDQYNWEKIAEKTKEVYLEILDEYRQVSWGNNLSSEFKGERRSSSESDHHGRGRGYSPATFDLPSSQASSSRT